ncbi:MAG: hypothetical protein LUH56_00980 [Oscillospiraceae bacterium]|nr:hypothetical protein [Oscillospiraceae bacterium]
MKIAEMKTMSINEFQNPEKVSEMCKENSAPFLVKNDDGDDMVIMNMEVYKEIFGVLRNF